MTQIPRERSIRSKEKVPYVVPLLVAMIAWGIQHFVDRVLDSPSIEYQVKTAGSSRGTRVEYILTNLSRNILFTSVHFTWDHVAGEETAQALRLRDEPFLDPLGVVTGVAGFLGRPGPVLVQKAAPCVAACLSGNLLYNDRGISCFRSSLRFSRGNAF